MNKINHSSRKKISSLPVTLSPELLTQVPQVREGPGEGWVGGDSGLVTLQQDSHYQQGQSRVMKQLTTHFILYIYLGRECPSVLLNIKKIVAWLTADTQHKVACLQTKRIFL